jgi:hypothetical protein
MCVFLDQVEREPRTRELKRMTKEEVKAEKRRVNDEITQKRGIKISAKRRG